jgi:hypothetical protein
MLLGGMTSWMAQMYDDDQYVEFHDLSLNCAMPRAQLRVTLTPKFSTLQRIVLVVTCAPSLETCYVFEVATQHLLQDFGKFNSDGSKVVQRWCKFNWRESTDGVVNKMSNSLSGIVKTHIDHTAKLRRIAFPSKLPPQSPRNCCSHRRRNRVPHLSVLLQARYPVRPNKIVAKPLNPRRLTHRNDSIVSIMNRS